MNDSVFVDTNILIYAYDLDAGAKHNVASEIVRNLWLSRRGVISTQILQEFYVTVTKKISSPLTPSRARGVIKTYESWHLQINDLGTIMLGSELQERYTLSFWDGMVLAAARQAGARVLLTEDLNSGQVVEGIEINNPFATTKKECD